MLNDNIQKAKELKSQGFSYKQIADMLGSKPSTIWDWVTGRKRNEDVYVGVTPTPFKKPVAPVANNIKEEMVDFILQLAPIQINKPIRQEITQTSNPYALVLGDIHFGSEDWDVLNIFLQAVEEIRPSTIVLNGDTLDMFAISKYSKDIRYNTSLLKEREEFHKFLYLLHEVTASHKTDIYETNANHSGDGLEGRWWRYLSERIGELGEIPEIKEKLSYQSIFYPQADWNKTKLVDFLEIVEGFIIMHGDVVRRHGGYSARGLFEKWFTSIMCNHTHRIGMTPQRIPSIGSQKEKIIRVYENGCACNLKPLYASAANWQNAFSIINYSSKDVAVETVLVTNKKATIATLGKTLKA
jgi:transcriptional regulator with XRE-family HTH domain